MTGLCRCSGCRRCGDRCRTPIQKAVRFADYCVACHRAHLCTRCGWNAVASSCVEPFCSVCLSTRGSWCACTGCDVHANICRQDKQKAKRYAGYCKRCAPHWRCPSCNVILPDSPAGDLLLACPVCHPAQCLCPGCANHSPATARCTALGNSALAGYCHLCAPAWRCSCSLQCYHHQSGAQCPEYVVVADLRLLPPAQTFYRCAKCSVHYCACKDRRCPNHCDVLCGRRRLFDGLCQGCVRRDCHCAGCRACTSPPCTRRAHFHDERRTCLPCARGQLHQLAAAHSWSIRFPCESFVDSLRECSSFDLSCLTGTRLVRSRALLKALRSRLFAEVPEVDISSATAQTFVLLRPSSVLDWSCFTFRSFWYNHCVAGRRTEVRFSAELTAEDFQGIGDALALPYGGTFRHCHGDIANFASVLADLPHYPFDVPVRSRPTYWKLPRACGAEDLIPASLDSVLLSVVHCIHGLTQLPDPSIWAKALRTLARIACDDDIGRPAFIRQLSDFFQHTSAEAWSLLPASLARPMLLAD